MKPCDTFKKEHTKLELDEFGNVSCNETCWIEGTQRGFIHGLDVYFEEDDETETYKLVTTVRGNSLKGYVSIDSPLGKAILGHKVGDRVTVKVSDAYSYDLIIKSIENTADTDDELRSY